MTDLLFAPKRMIELEIDGRSVRVFEGETILGACRQHRSRGGFRRYASRGGRCQRRNSSVRRIGDV